MLTNFAESNINSIHNGDSRDICEDYKNTDFNYGRKFPDENWAMDYGWAIGKGLSPDEAYAFALFQSRLMLG